MDEPLNGTSDETISQESKPSEPLIPAPKVLSPKEKVVLEKNRKQFRAIHDALASLDIYEAEAVLGLVTGSVSNAYQMFQDRVQVKELKMAKTDGVAGEILTICNDLDVQRVLAYSEALHNAINRHKYVKTKDWTVKDLDIELL